MTPAKRLIVAIFIVVVDLAVVVVPLAAIFIAYVLLFRPPKFRAWVLRLYEG